MQHSPANRLAPTTSAPRSSAQPPRRVPRAETARVRGGCVVGFALSHLQPISDNATTGASEPYTGTVLALLALLTARGRKDDSISAAAIIRLVDREHCTLLCDEADNLGLGHNSILRAVLNSGHRKGGSRTLLVKDAPRRFSKLLRP
jgi:hypothetical protein